MSATPATINGTQNGPVEPGVKSPARTAVESSVNRGATDDEILGLTTKVRRRDSHGVQTPAETSRGTGEFDQLELDFASENRRQNGETTSGVSSSAPETRKAVKNGDAEVSNDPAGAAAEAVTAAGIAEPAHLKPALEANPELRAAWREAKAYREAFATPEAARAATGMLADLNRMDALFFSRRPEDHAKLARAVADLDPDAFESLARAMTQVAHTAGATFPAIAARSASTERGAATDVRHAMSAAELGSSGPQQAVSVSTGV